MTIQEKVLKLIAEERERQDKKWGEQNHKPDRWAVILGEEYGEVCRAIFEETSSQYLAELVQVAAVAAAAAECEFRRQQNLINTIG
jgi:NTP pyrophosphatase (non-canonical NTP hydrolase)